MSKNKVVKNYIYNTAYQILLLIAPLITTPYVSRVLGAEGIGVYSYAQSIATYFVLVGAVGTTLYGQREIAYVQDSPEKRTAIFWEITVFRFVAVIISSAVYFFIFGFSGKYAVIYRILMLEVLATAFDISWFFMGLENFRLTVIRNTIIKLIGIALIFILVKNADDVPLYTLCLTLPIFIGNISLWFGLPKYLVKLPGSVFWGIPKHIKPILILFLPQIASEVYLVLDKTMIGVFSSGIDQVGYYTQGQKIIKIILHIVTSLGTVMLPAMSAAFAQGKIEKIQKDIRTSFRFVFMLGCALLFGICAVSSRFVPFFFGNGYEPVVKLMIIISPIIIIIGISNVIGKQYLLPTKQQGAYTVSIVSGALVNFVLNFILIRKFDAIGASVATVLAELAVTLVQCWFVRKQLHLWKCLRSFFRYLLFGIVMFAIVRVCDRILPSGVISLVVMVVVGVLVYLLELVFTKDELLQRGLDMVMKKVREGY